MRTQLQVTREFAMPRTNLYDFILDPGNWTRYYNNVASIESVAPWHESGDQLRLTYRILGRTVELAAQLVAAEPGRSTDVEFTGAGVPDANHRWTFEDCSKGTRVTVVLETKETTDWFGTPVDRLTVARALERDLIRSLDNLSELIPLGIA